MSQYYCLISQKETKERNKIKCLITSCDQIPEDYVAELQENHCMEYQLVIYSMRTDELVSEVEELCKEKKTGYGKCWYELSDSDLAAVISTHFRRGKVIFDFTCVSDIVQHTLSLTSLGGDERVHVVPAVERPNIAQKFHQESIIEHVPVDTVGKKAEISGMNFSKSEFTRSESAAENRKHKGFEVKIRKMVVTSSDYKRFISKRCLKDDGAKVPAVELNDSFIDYLTEAKKFRARDFSHADDKESLFKGFVRLGYEPIDSGKRFYVKGLRLKKNATK